MVKSLRSSKTFPFHTTLSLSLSGSVSSASSRLLPAKTHAMPELPEVEAARRAIKDHCLGHKITRAVVTDDPKVIDGVSSSDFEASLTGKTIPSARRKGKNMWLQLDYPPFPSFQFGMTGAVYIKGVAVTKYKRSAVKDEDEWPSKYSKVFIELDNGVEFSFTDETFRQSSSTGRCMIGWLCVLSCGGLGCVRVLLLVLATGLLMKCYTMLGFIPLRVLQISPRKVVQRYTSALKGSLRRLLKLGLIVANFLLTGYFVPGKRSLARLSLMGRRLISSLLVARTTAYVPELQKLGKAQSEKALNKQRRQSTKKKGNAEDDNDDVDEAETIEKTNGSAKSRKMQKPRGKGGKPTKRKADKSSDKSDDDDVNTDEKSDDDDSNEKKKMTRKKKSKQVTEKTSKKNTQASLPKKKQKK